MADHDLFVKFNTDTQQFEPKRLRVTFYDRDVKRTKFDDSEQYWRTFVQRWWHHDGLRFALNTLTTDQQNRLDAVNAQGVGEQYLSEVAEYVLNGAVAADSTAPYLSTLVDDPAVVDARVERLRADLRQRLAEYRYRIEIGGADAPDGTHILTDRESQAQLTSAYQTLKEGLRSAVDWKAPTGWQAVTLTEITPVATFAATHVQLAFSAEREVDTAITAETDPAVLEAYDPQGAFDTAFANLWAAENA